MLTADIQYEDWQTDRHYLYVMRSFNARCASKSHRGKGFSYFSFLGVTESTWNVGHSLAYCTSSGWCMMINVEQLVEWELTGETEIPGETLPQCHFVHHKSPRPDLLSNSGRGGGKPESNRLSYGTANLILSDKMRLMILSSSMSAHCGGPSRLCLTSTATACTRASYSTNSSLDFGDGRKPDGSSRGSSVRFINKDFL
jgi:hypothetical protein